MQRNIKSVLITGSAGFIGLQTLKEFINHEYFVYAMIHKSIPEELLKLEHSKKIEILRGDITNYNSMKETLQKCCNINAIIHCAGRASDIGWASEFKKTNYNSVKHLVKLTIENNIERLIFVSTTDVYGLKDFNGETEEELDYDTKARNNYPKYKILAEQWIKTNLPKNRYSIIRPAAVWGDNDPTLTKRIRDFLAWSPYIIHFGKSKGTNRWPIVDVKHVAKANYLATISPQALGQAINILEPQHITIDMFYHMIANKYLPNKKFKTITLPLWLGIIIGTIVSLISNLLNLKYPIIDPSLYALYSVSRNLDFSCQKYQDLINSANKETAT